MFRLFIANLVTWVLLTPAAPAIDLILSGSGNVTMGENSQSPTISDADGDGWPEMCSELGDEPGPFSLLVQKLDGSEVWSYGLERLDVCPSCNPDNWGWWFLGFGEVDPSPLREAVLNWSDFDTGQYGVAVVNLSTNAIVLNAVGAVCHDVCDFDGNGSQEIILSYQDGWEIWAHPFPNVNVALDDDRRAVSRSLASLSCNPNPLRATGTTIAFELANPVDLSIVVIDCQGRLVLNLGRAHWPPGCHTDSAAS